MRFLHELCGPPVGWSWPTLRQQTRAPIHHFPAIRHFNAFLFRDIVCAREFRKRLAANTTSGVCAVTPNILSFNTALNLCIMLFGTPQSVRRLCSYRPTHLLQREISCCLHLSRKQRSIFTSSTVSSTSSRTWHRTQPVPSRQDINPNVLASSCDVSATSVTV